METRPELIQQAFRIKLAPTPEQERFLASCCGAMRFWFNQGLALVKERLDERATRLDVDVPWSYKSLCVAFRGDAIKDELAPWRDEVVTGSYQAGLEALGRALQNFSNARKAGRPAGFPRFRAKGRGHEAVIFQRPRLPDNRHVCLDRRLGPIRTKESLRKLTRLLDCDEQARILRSTVQRANNPANYLPDGRAKPGARSWAKSQRMLRTERRIASLHERVANLRREQAHQLTTALTREFGVIGVETLTVRNLLANRRLARQLSDAGWGTILAQLAYKTSWSDGSILVAAGRFYPSSKTCSACGAVRAKLSLAERVFTCDDCGHEQDRDLNAALNLVAMARQHAQAEGIESYVARTGRFTINARGGQVGLVHLDEHSPVKREESSDSAQRREALALACLDRRISAH